MTRVRDILVSYAQPGGFGRAFLRLAPGVALNQAAIERFERVIAEESGSAQIVIISVSEMDS